MQTRNPRQPLGRQAPILEASKTIIKQQTRKNIKSVWLSKQSGVTISSKKTTTVDTE